MTISTSAVPSVATEVTGLGGAIGCDFISAAQRLVFVEYSGNLSRFDMSPSATVVSSGTTVLQGTYAFDLDTGTEGGANPAEDIWWEQETDVARQMVPQNGAGIVNIGIIDFTALSSAALQSLAYGSTPIPGNNDSTNQLVDGDVFAVRTTSGNYAKVLVQTYGYDLTIQWVTYQLDPAYAVLGTGYEQPEDVRVSGDGSFAYVTERAGNLLLVDLSNADRVNATMIASGMNAPQQLFVDQNAGLAYTVEYAASGTLWRVDLNTSAMTAVVTGLDHAVGLVLSADGGYAYISEQSTGPDGGRVSQFRLSDGTRTALATGLTAPFFLTWTTTGQTGLYCLQRDPANSLVTVDPAGGGATALGVPLAFRPSCCSVVNPGLLLVTCDQELDLVTLSATSQADGPILESIGFVPFDWITLAGLADTTDQDPSYFYQVQNAPFGGSLPVMVNFVRANADGAVGYRVYVDGAPRTDQFNTAKWDGTQYEPVVISTTTIGGVADSYPVPSLTDLGLYIQPLPGCYLDSTTLSDGTLHTIEVSFFGGSGNLLETSPGLSILVDNRPCAVTLDQAAIGGTSATTACGFLPYNPATAATDQLTIAYTATQPGGYGTWVFSVTKSAASLYQAQGAVPAPGTFQESVGDMLGSCTVAAYAAEVGALATAVTGWWRCSQYDRWALEAFALAP
jgi:hypothetical protein